MKNICYSLFQKFDFTGVTSTSINMKLKLGDRVSTTAITSNTPTKGQIQAVVEELFEKECSFNFDPKSRWFYYNMVYGIYQVSQKKVLTFDGLVEPDNQSSNNYF